MPVVQVAHPLIKHHLSRLRDKHTPPAEFRQLVQRLAVLLAYEATSDLSVRPVEIETPLVRTTGRTAEVEQATAEAAAQLRQVVRLD